MVTPDLDTDDPITELPPTDPDFTDADADDWEEPGEMPDPGHDDVPDLPRGAEMPDDATSWAGLVKPSTRSTIDVVIAAARAAGLPLALVWGLSKTGEHRLGYSADYMTWNLSGNGHDARIGEFVARYAWAHRWHLAVRYLIWNRRIRNDEYDNGAWRTYTGKSAHTDHVHVCRYPRAYVPRAKPLPSLSNAAVNAALRGKATHPTYTKRLQKALNLAVLDGAALLVPDGDAGKLTRAKVMAWQRQINRPATGMLAPPEHKRLAIASGNYTAKP